MAGWCLAISLQSLAISAIGETEVSTDQPAEGGSTTGQVEERPSRPEGPEISYESLLWDLGDRSTFTYFPDPPYVLRSSTSAHPAGAEPAENADQSSSSNPKRYVRTFERDGRTERVMLDAEGPGVVTRIFAEYPTGTLRIYIDDLQQPVIEESMEKLLSGSGTWGAPMCDRTGKGWNSFVPIPFAKRCIITHDGDPLVYEVEYRDYDETAPVISLTRNQIEKHRRLMYALQRSLVLARPPRASVFESVQKNLDPGERVELWTLSGPADITELAINADFEDRNRERGVRTLILRIEFDGRETVWCPLGDFNGSAPGVNQYKSWRVIIDQMNWNISRWYMPFQKSAKIFIENHGVSKVQLRSSVRYRTDYEWNDRSMYFHAAWRFKYPQPGSPKRDWNVIDVLGKGVFVGDSLAVTNPVREWWGAGAPKIYVDDPSRPALVSNSTDQYYGFNADTGEPFQTPFHGRPRQDGPGDYGHSLVNRYRGLGGVPFQDHLRFDLEIDHQNPAASFAIAATAFWYALPGATSNAETYDDDTLQTVPDVKRPSPTYLIENAEEGENLAVLRTEPHIEILRRRITKEKLYSQDAFLLASPRDVGAKAEISIPVPEPGRYHVTAYMATCPSCGMVFFLVNDEETQVATDLYNQEDPYDFGATGPVDLGEWESIGDAIILTIEVVGTNDKSEPPHYDWGIDAIVVEKVD